MRNYAQAIRLRGVTITKELLQSIFEYRDGKLYWKIKTLMPQQKVGDRAGTHKPNGYREIGFGGKVYKEHRLIWFIHYGITDQFIDHKDCDPSNNDISNLRIANRQDNSRNRGKYKNNTSGFKGVSFFKATRKWHAKIRDGERERHLGFFTTPELAHEAYKNAAIELHGEFARY